MSLDIRHPLLVSFLIVSIALLAHGCGDPGQTPSDDAGVDVSDAGASPCQTWCSNMQDCGQMGVSQSQCEQGCQEALEPAFVQSCTQCLESSCDQAWSACFQSGGACYREPVTSYIATIGEFSDEAEGLAGHGRLVSYSGHELGAFDDSTVTQKSMQLSFGTVLSPGLEYRMQYWVDYDGDGVCDPAVDNAYEQTFFLENDSVVVAGYPELPAQPQGDLCEEFTSTSELCTRECERRQTCDSLTGDLQTCRQNCIEDASPATLTRCVSCLEDFACDEHAAACDQADGVCNDEYVEPETEFLIAGSGYGDYEGETVFAQVEDLSGQVLTPLLDDTIEEAGFFIHFGKSVWMNQTYVVVFFIDADADGACGSSDPGWALEVAVEDSSLHYEMLPNESMQPTDVCERIQE